MFAIWMSPQNSLTWIPYKFINATSIACYQNHKASVLQFSKHLKTKFYLGFNSADFWFSELNRIVHLIRIRFYVAGCWWRWGVSAKFSVNLTYYQVFSNCLHGHFSPKCLWSTAYVLCGVLCLFWFFGLFFPKWMQEHWSELHHD